MPPKLKKSRIATRFRGLMPVVVDIESSGLNPLTDALLEIAVIPVTMNSAGVFYPIETYAFHVEPFLGANIDPVSLELTGIDPGYPLRYAIPEKQALHLIFTNLSRLLTKFGCHRAILVGHNAWFDLAFIKEAVKRAGFANMPFHSFTTLDTATLGAMALGETVLAKALRAANIPFDLKKAHSAIYDAERTAELFCYIANNK